jgi:hypothetical protein
MDGAAPGTHPRVEIPRSSISLLLCLLGSLLLIKSPLFASPPVCRGGTRRCRRRICGFVFLRVAFCVAICSNRSPFHDEVLSENPSHEIHDDDKSNDHRPRSWRGTDGRDASGGRTGADFARRIQQAAPLDQTPGGRVTLDGNRLASRRVGSAAEGRAGRQAAVHLGRERRRARGGLLKRRAIGP